MKRLMLTSAVLLACFSGQAMAVCARPFLNETQLKDLLPGKTVCSPANCSGAAGACNWQEFHSGAAPGGPLVDYKKGPTDTMDPTETVGTWAITPPNAGSPAKVVHDYGPGNFIYKYDVHLNSPGNWSFCGPNGEFTFTVKTGQQQC